MTILVHGGPESHPLYRVADSIHNISNLRVQSAAQAMLLSAIKHRKVALSSNQVGFHFAMFVQHKYPRDDQWEFRGDKALEPKDFQLVLNPKVTGETVEQEFAWEHCPSFPDFRAKVKRPVGIQVQFSDQLGEQIDRELQGFDARVFLSSLEKLQGQILRTWKVEECQPLDLEVEERYQNLMESLDFYKDRIKEFKQKHPDYLQDQREFQHLSRDQQMWKIFKVDRKKQESFNFGNLAEEAEFEKTMITDFIRAIRKDHFRHQVKE